MNALLLPDDLISFTEAARLARCHVGTVHRWRLKQKLRAWLRAGRWFCSQAELLALFQPAQARPAAAVPQARTVAAYSAWADGVLRQAGIKK